MIWSYSIKILKLIQCIMAVYFITSTHNRVWSLYTILLKRRVVHAHMHASRWERCCLLDATQAALANTCVITRSLALFERSFLTPDHFDTNRNAAFILAETKTAQEAQRARQRVSAGPAPISGAPGMAPAVAPAPPWAARLLADAAQFAGRVQLVVRFLVAAALRPLLDRAFPGAQVPVVLLCCIALQAAVARAPWCLLLRDVAFSLLGLCLPAALEPRAAHSAPAQAASLLLRTFVLVLPPLVLGVGAGLGFRTTLAYYAQSAVTAYQYTYAAAVGGLLRPATGPGPVLLGLAALRVSAARGAGPAAGPPAAAPPLLAEVRVVCHLVLVDMLVHDLAAMHAAPHVQLGLVALALVGLDALGAVLAHEAAELRATLEQMHSYALWKASQLLVQSAALDVVLASCLALMLAAARTTLALVRPARAGSVSLLDNVSQVAFLAGVNMLLRPATSIASQSLAQHLLRVTYFAALANFLERALS